MRNFLLLLSLSLMGIAGCNATTGASYPTGYNTPAAGATLNSFKASTIPGYTCVADPACLVVYTVSGSTKGVAVGNAALTNTLKIYTTDGVSYTVVRTGAGACSSAFNGTFDDSAGKNGNGLYPITITSGANACSSGITGVITAQIYP